MMASLEEASRTPGTIHPGKNRDPEDFILM